MERSFKGRENNWIGEKGSGQELWVLRRSGKLRLGLSAWEREAERRTTKGAIQCPCAYIQPAATTNRKSEPNPPRRNLNRKSDLLWPQNPNSGCRDWGRCEGSKSSSTMSTDGLSTRRKKNSPPSNGNTNTSTNVITSNLPFPPALLVLVWSGHGHRSACSYKIEYI
jgi:hypothetical protein